MKTNAKAGCLVIAWMAAGFTASAQWNVITEPLPPVQPAPGLRALSPPQARPFRNSMPRTVPREWDGAYGYGGSPREWDGGPVNRCSPPWAQIPPQQPAPRPQPEQVRPLESYRPARRPNPPRQRPDDPYVERQIRRQEGYGYDYDYGGRGVPPAGHYDMRGGRDVELMDTRGVRAQVPQQPPRREVRYPKGAVVVAELKAGGEAKEVVVNREISRCYLELVSGTVSINTVVVRPEKTPLPQTTRLQEGKLHLIDLGGKRMVSGFRISDNGRGVYRVIVQ